MNDLKKYTTATVLICIFLLMSTLPVMASDHTPEKTSMKDVQKKMSEFLETIKSYSADQKNEAIQSVKAEMERLDNRMDELQSRLDRKWDEMDQSSRKKAREYMNTLQRQREELAEWYGGMKHSSLAAWQKVKTGFVESYENLEASFEEAKNQF